MPLSQPPEPDVQDTREQLLDAAEQLSDSPCLVYPDTDLVLLRQVEVSSNER